MKTRCLFIGAMLLSLCCFTSCNDDENLDGPAPDVIWDIYPFGISIEVTDAEGNDLLNPETENSIANQGIKMIYRNKTYKKDSLVTDEQTRDILVRFYGLQTYQRKDGSYLLAIGEFYGKSNIPVCMRKQNGSCQVFGRLLLRNSCPENGGPGVK